MTRSELMKLAILVPHRTDHWILETWADHLPGSLILVPELGGYSWSGAQEERGYARDLTRARELLTESLEAAGYRVEIPEELLTPEPAGLSEEPPVEVVVPFGPPPAPEPPPVVEAPAPLALAPEPAPEPPNPKTKEARKRLNKRWRGLIPRVAKALLTDEDARRRVQVALFGSPSMASVNPWKAHNLLSSLGVLRAFQDSAEEGDELDLTALIGRILAEREAA